MNSATLVSHEVPLQSKLAALRDVATYSDATAGVEAIETHCAWVFLTDHHAYKLKKPMRLGRMNNLRLSSRRQNCLEELRLNRRLASEVYLDVVALRSDSAGRLSLDGDGVPAEWLVKMRRLPADLQLDHAIAAGTVSCEAIGRVTEMLAAFYRRQPPVQLSSDEYLRRMERQVAANGDGLLDPDLGLPRSLVHAALMRQEEFLTHRSRLLEERARAGKIVEAHGDLKPEHIFLGQPPCAIDCLEFDRDLRLLDPLEELSYLALECERLGAEWIGRQLLAGYAEQSGDRAESALIDFYMSRRATQRALTVAWHLRDPAVRTLKDWRTISLGYVTKGATEQFPPRP